MLDFFQNGFARIQSALVAVRDREEGQAMVEYALILALVSVAAIVTLGLVGGAVDTTLNSVLGSL
jgi:pilus assembly protein Flp/PilA